jgi:hypothetical protein
MKIKLEIKRLLSETPDDVYRINEFIYYIAFSGLENAHKF